MSAVANIYSLEKRYSMERFYSVIGRTRQSYHKAIVSQSIKMQRDQDIIDQVLIFRTRHPRMGSRALYYTMIQAGIDLSIGVNTFEKLLSRRNLTVGTAKRSSPQTSDGLGRRNYPNMASGLVLNDINQLIAADITYFWVDFKWCYLFILKDVYSQRIISLVPSENMKASNAIQTLTDLKRLRGKEALKDCVHHSDNGSQYDDKRYKAILCKLNMKISRARSCEENGSLEQTNHIVKNMYLKHFGVTTFKELKAACKKVKYLMNEERAVKQLGNNKVSNFEKALHQIPLNERKHKTMHDFDNDP